MEGRRYHELLSPRRNFLLATACLMLLLAGAPPVFAGDVTVDCNGLQSALTTADSGDVITLNQMCSGTKFTLSPVSITLQGTSGAGFDGGASRVGPLLSGQNIPGITIRDLIFSNAGTGSGGGAIYLIASWGSVIDSTFTGNSAQNGGGAVGLTGPVSGAGETVISGNVFGGDTPTLGNSSREFVRGGGGVAVSTGGNVTIADNHFENNAAPDGAGLSVDAGPELVITDNTFIGNTAGFVDSGSCGPTGCGAIPEAAESLGGGALVIASASTTIADNVFRSNVVDGPDVLSAFGGGLHLVVESATVTQRGNLFKDNQIDDLVSSGGDIAGGGESIRFGSDAADPGEVFSRNDRMIANTSLQAGTKGGGLALLVDHFSPSFDANNLVIAGNDLPAGGLGGGLFIGEGPEGCFACPSSSIVRNASIVGNSAGSGSGGQVHTGSGDTLDVRNSIIYGNGTTSDFVAPGPGTTTHSDVCADAVPQPGDSNICADPKLNNPATGDVRETAQSPTRDKGRNALVPQSLTTDYTGELRIIDSDANGTATVDMGADEARARPRITIVVDPSASGLVVKGAVAPNNSGRDVSVSLMRKVQGQFRNLSTKTDDLDSLSRYGVSFRRPAPGTCKTKIAFAGSPTTLPGARTKTFAC